MYKIMFVGAGKMGSALASGTVRGGNVNFAEMIAADVLPEAAKAFEDNTGIRCITENFSESAGESAVIFLAVKPQNLEAAVNLLKDGLNNQCLISIVAGVTIEKLQFLTGLKRVIRVMPNTPAMYGCGAAAYAVSADIGKNDEQFARELFSAVGTVEKTEEKYLDAVTGLSGSGPAYVFEFIQALSDGGVAKGLPRAVATRLAAQTVLGAAQMVLKSGRHPGELRDMVTSPAGTTIRGLEILADRAFSGSVIAAVKAAAERSEELGKGK